ncbi:MAG: transposase [Spirochaetaceae bacterium]|nr:transposase [Spirochaetaceae bacterium]
MRSLRILAAVACYFASTAVNNREPLFWCSRERARFKRVLDEAHVLYAFVLYGLCFDGPAVSFYIKPDDGLQLPEIMQWIKQTYACRYNVYDGRTGHIWGDRYESKIVAEGPPKYAEEYVFVLVVCEAASRRVRKAVKAGRGGVTVNGGSAASPATGAEGRPCTGETARNSGPPPDLPHHNALSHD